MKYKEGDKVRIKSLDWYNKNKDEYGNIDVSHDFTFYADRSKYCGKVLTIVEVFDICYAVKEDNNKYYWSDEMIEGLVEEETKNWADTSIPDGPYTVTYDSPSMNDSVSKNIIYNEIILPKGYIFKDDNGNVINATKIVLEKKGKKYPKTYEECKYILGITTPMVRPDYNGDLIVALQKLLICRDAYWKIAGDWKPEFRFGKKKYSIMTKDNKVISATVEETNRILAFPTEEMRDAFYENFKELIKQCKELL